MLLALSELCERLIGKGFSALGFLPSVLALALYSMLPVLRNTVVGLNGIDDGMRDAARALAMTPRQTLWLVELPLAMPVIMAGIRTAAVWVIGTATLSTPIGQTSLGNYIFAGLQTQNWVFVLFGCVAAAALALVVDQLLALMEHGVNAHSRGMVVAGGVGLVLVVLAALLPGYGRAQATYAIGAKPFTEQYVLAALIEQRLEAQGCPRKAATGSAPASSSMRSSPATSTPMSTIPARSGPTKCTAATSSRAPRCWPRCRAGLQATHGIRLLGPLGFENAYALAMPRAQAEALGIRSIADLAAHAGELSIAGDYEFFERPEWKAIREAYGLRFRAQRTMQSDFMYKAAAARRRRRDFGLHQRRPHRTIRSDGARRSQARHPAL